MRPCRNACSAAPQTSPMPNSRAMSIASRIARVPTTKPKPSWPSSAAATGVTRCGASAGRGLIRPRRRPVEIDRQPAEAMGVDPAQIGAHQAAGDDGRVLVGQPWASQQAPGEAFGAPRRHGIDAVGLDGLRRRHQSLISRTCLRPRACRRPAGRPDRCRSRHSARPCGRIPRPDRAAWRGRRRRSACRARRQAAIVCA